MAGKRKGKKGKSDEKPRNVMEAAKFVEATQQLLLEKGIASYKALSELVPGAFVEAEREGEKLELVHGEMYIYYDKEVHSFIAVGGKLNSQPPIPICPYLGCKVSSGRAFQCDHFREEKKANLEVLDGRVTQPPIMIAGWMDCGRKWNAGDELRAVYLKDDMLTYEGIGMIMDIVADARGVRDRRTLNGQGQLLKSVGAIPFYDDKMGMMVTRAGHGSRSFIISQISEINRTMTCGEPSCNSHGICYNSANESYTCRNHAHKYSSIGNSTFRDEVSTFMKEGILKGARVEGRSCGWDETDEWIAALKYLFSLGEFGYCHEDYKMIARIRLVGRAGLVMEHCHGTTSFMALCLMRGCIDRPVNIYASCRQLSNLKKLLPKDGVKITRMEQLAPLVMCPSHAKNKEAMCMLKRLCNELDDEQYGKNREQLANYGHYAQKGLRLVGTSMVMEPSFQLPGYYDTAHQKEMKRRAEGFEVVEEDKREVQVHQKGLTDFYKENAKYFKPENWELAE